MKSEHRLVYALSVTGGPFKNLFVPYLFEPLLRRHGCGASAPGNEGVLTGTPLPVGDQPASIHHPMIAGGKADRSHVASGHDRSWFHAPYG